jgi:hypothetical protein
VGGYRRSSLVSTFAAAFPMDRPRYVVIAMLDEPQGTAASSGQRTAGLERRAGRRPGRAAHRPAAGRDARRNPRRRHFRPVAAGPGGAKE